MDIYKIIHPRVSVTGIVNAAADADGIIKPGANASGSVVTPSASVSPDIIKPAVSASGIIIPKLVRLILTGAEEPVYLYPDTLYPGTLYPVGD